MNPLKPEELAARLEYHAKGDSLNEVRKGHPFAADVIAGHYLDAASLIRSLAERVEKLEGALQGEGRRKAVLIRCAVALKSLPEDALGFGESGGAHWPLRDELLDAIILSMPDPAGMRAALERP